MKSKYPDQIKTSCKDCVFSIYDKDTQIGCEAGRTSVFEKQGDLVEAYDDEKEFYTVSRLCNIATHDDTTLEDARKKAAPTIDVYVDCTNIELEPYEEREQSLRHLKDKFDYYDNKLNIILINDYYKVSKDQRAKIYELHETLNAEIVSYMDREFTLHERCYKSKKSYHCILPVHADFKEIFYKVDKLVNEDLEKIVTCKIDDFFFISNLAYKIYALNKESVSYESNIKDVITDSKERNLHKEL
tara:strand:+ start:1152 stop:1883 length:732 start_codon:yes stop_codon:yes gene_type:complete